MAGLIGRHPDGRRWCERCARRYQAAATVADNRARVAAAVRAVEPHLSTRAIQEALTEAASAPRTLRLLAEHFDARPDALTDGPSSTVPVLRRFVEALQAAGARRVRVRHPTCVECGQPGQAKKRLTTGWICVTCHSRILRPCDRCGQQRRPYARDGSAVLCDVCTRRQRNAEHDAAVTAEILDAVRTRHAPHLDAATLTAMVRAAAPRPVDRRQLAAHIASITVLTEQPPLPLARLIIALTGTGAAGLPLLHCHDCGHPVGDDGHASLTAVQCGPCARHCPDCGRPHRRPGNRICARCRHDHRRPSRRGTCVTCQRGDRILDEHSRCRFCRQRDQRSCLDCGSSTTPMRHIHHGEVCDPCVLRRTLDPLLPEQTAPALQRLRTAILAADPVATLQWLTRPRTGTILAALHTGQLDCSHAALDALPPGRDLEHLRAMLVAGGALPTDPHRLINRLADELNGLLHDLPAGDQRIVRAWLRWRVLAQLRRAADTGRDLTAPIYNARATCTQVVAFAVALQQAGRQLETCRQSDIDGWFATPPTTRAHIRTFLSWTHSRGYLPKNLRLPPHRRSQPGNPADPEGRWVVARRLVHDGTLDISDRVAGALVVLYAQPLTRIAELTTTQVTVDRGQVTVALGTDRIELPEPFAYLITKLPHRRRPGTAAHLPNQWLFPSTRAGRHATPAALANRLRRIGIAGRAMRQATLIQLAAEIPPGMLAGILGIHPTTAVKWTKLAGGDWSGYAAGHRAQTT